MIGKKLVRVAALCFFSVVLVTGSFAGCSQTPEDVIVPETIGTKKSIDARIKREGTTVAVTMECPKDDE